MERILTSELAAHVGERVLLQGWLHRKRELSRVSFLILRDRAGLAQIVIDESPELLTETVLEIEGLAVENAQAPGGVEVHEPQIRVLAEPNEAPPIELHRPEPKESLPTRLDAAAVSLRHPVVRERFRLAARAVAAFRASLDRLGFVEIQTPKIVASATEGGANVFPVDYFGREAFLAQSPQFYKQTMVGVFERVYEVGPVFRAEPHETGRHLAEYTSLDAELGFIHDHRDVIASAARCSCSRCSTRSVRSRPPRRRSVRFEDVRTGEEPDLSPADERRICAGARRARLRRGLPDPETAVLHASGSGAAGVVARLRPPVPRAGDRHRRAATAPVRGLPRRTRAARPRRGAVRLLPRRVPLRDAAARRLRARPRALRGAGRRSTQRAGDDAVSARSLPSPAVSRPMLGRT